MRLGTPKRQNPSTASHNGLLFEYDLAILKARHYLKQPLPANVSLLSVPLLPCPALVSQNLYRPLMSVQRLLSLRVFGLHAGVRWPGLA